MGVFTHVQQPLGLHLTPRLEKIIKAYQEDTEITKDDISYLIDEAARYTTFARRVKQESFKLKGYLLQDEYEIKEVLGKLFDEMNWIEAHKLGQDGIYKMDLPQFSPFDDDISKMTYKQVEYEIRHGIRLVRDMQKTFDDNEDEIVVHGKLKHLKKRYKVDIILLPDSDYEKVAKELTEHIKTILSEEIKEREEGLARLSKE